MLRCCSARAHSARGGPGCLLRAMLTTTTHNNNNNNNNNNNSNNNNNNSASCREPDSKAEIVSLKLENAVSGLRPNMMRSSRVHADSRHYNSASLMEELSRSRLATGALTFASSIKASNDNNNNNSNNKNVGIPPREASSQLMSSTKSEAYKDTIVFNACVSACEKAGQWQHALGLLSDMASLRVHRNTITYNASISACEKGGQWEHSLDLLCKMDLNKVEKCAITYNASIAACDKGGQW
ncbi:unnamed protein product, partial [Polarella glacialis]